jgi:hypothetical protein
MKSATDLVLDFFVAAEGEHVESDTFVAWARAMEASTGGIKRHELVMARKELADAFVLQTTFAMSDRRGTVMSHRIPQ